MRALALVLLLASCVDPTHAREVDALGPEAPGVPPGPLHRPGQSCAICHGERGPAELELAAAGTVYLRQVQAEASRLEPLAGATVRITDARGAVFEATTNEVGNFHLRAAGAALDYPVFVTVVHPARGGEKEMKTRIGREASCNACHRLPAGAAHSPPVFLKEIGEP